MDIHPVKIVVLVLVSPFFWAIYTQVVPDMFRSALNRNETFLARYMGALGSLIFTAVPIALTAAILALKW